MGNGADATTTYLSLQDFAIRFHCSNPCRFAWKSLQTGSGSDSQYWDFAAFRQATDINWAALCSRVSVAKRVQFCLQCLLAWMIMSCARSRCSKEIVRNNSFSANNSKLKDTHNSQQSKGCKRFMTWPRSTPYVPLPVVLHQSLEPIKAGSFVHRCGCLFLMGLAGPHDPCWRHHAPWLHPSFERLKMWRRPRLHWHSWYTGHGFSMILPDWCCMWNILEQDLNVWAPV